MFFCEIQCVKVEMLINNSFATERNALFITSTYSLKAGV